MTDHMEQVIEPHAARLLKAHDMGFRAGRAAGTWVFDGNTSRNEYQSVLNGIVAGDPAILDAYSPGNGWLSGEWADGMTPHALVNEVYGLTGCAPEDAEDISDEYEAAADSGYWQEVERICRLHLGD